MMSEDLSEKKLRGSGGYAIARITEEEQKKGNLGGPELFLAGIGRLDEDRFSKYYCNKCEKQYDGSPAINYENPNEELGEGVTLLEKGEYKCKSCNSTIAQYRKFDAPAQQAQEPRQVPKESPTIEQAAPRAEEFVSIQSLVDMPAYDSEAMLVGKIKEIGLGKSAGKMQITVKIEGESGPKQVSWDNISKIGDIVLLRGQPSSGKCASCGYQNDAGSAFCEDCGSRL